jgi:hypothetical protein
MNDMECGNDRHRGMLEPGSARASRGAIGGASGDAGVEYRRAVAAYLVAHGLTGLPVSGFGVPPSDATVTAVSLETDDPVDDIAAEFGSGWRCTVQARRALRKGSPIDKALEQWRVAAHAGLDPRTDRLVIVTTHMSGPVQDLKVALDRLKTERPGALTGDQASALAYLKSRLESLTEAERSSVLKCASIHLLFVEEEDLQDAREGLLLLGRVVGDHAARKAWQDLIRIAGKTARLRGGFTVKGWLDLLRHEGHQILVDGATPAGQLERTQLALDRYRSKLRWRGEHVDLRPLGATLPPLPLQDADATIRVTAPGEDSRDSRDLLWAFLRRGRMLLTGLPGGGKSMAIAMTAARLLDVPDSPLPVVASLREVDGYDKSKGFGDRLLDAAVRDLVSPVREIVREELEHRLQQGDVALMLDALDETHARRADVVRELQDFLVGVSGDVDVLLATRDVAYAYGATLGWSDLRLAPPKEINRTVHEILQLRAHATVTDAAKVETWVRDRVRWVQNSLNRDPTLRETPLLPVLLALLASEKEGEMLPAHRADILAAVVRNVVERRETRRDDEFRVGDLVSSLAVKATIEGFATEAAEIVKRGGTCSLAQAHQSVADLLTTRWDLRAGRAEATAEAIVHFWDEAGIFVISGAEEKVAPRLELFAEVGDAIHAIGKTDAEIRTWVETTVAAERHEPLVLAAGLSSVAAHRLLELTGLSQDHELILAVTRAVREGADVTEAELRGLLQALVRDARVGDREAWSAWSQLAKLAVPEDFRPTVLDVLAAFPPDYQAIGRALVVLRWYTGQDLLRHADELLDALRVPSLPRLARRVQRNSPDWQGFLIDEGYAEAKERAAQVLLGVVEEATPLVVEALKHGSSSAMQKNLRHLLQQHGLGSLADDALREQTAKMSESIARFFRNFDEDAHLKLLRELCSAEPSALSYQQATRLNDLADFCETLNLNDASAWPRTSDNWDDFRRTLATVAHLGSFDIGVLSAEAAIVLRRIEAFNDDAAFFALFDQATRHNLDHWGAVPDRAKAVNLFIRMMSLGRGAALVASSALWKAPVADLALPLLVDLIPRLVSSPEHQRIAAYTLLSLTGGAEISEWASDPNPVLRKIAAEKITVEQDGTLSQEIQALLDDEDGNVVEAATQRLEKALASDRDQQLTRVANRRDPAWLCLHCRRLNGLGEISCDKCHSVGPSPSQLARTILEKSQHAEGVADLDRERQRS